MKENKKMVASIRCTGIKINYYSVSNPTTDAVVYTYTFDAEFPFGNLTVNDINKSLFTIGKEYTVTIASKV